MSPLSLPGISLCHSPASANTGISARASLLCSSAVSCRDPWPRVIVLDGRILIGAAQLSVLKTLLAAKAIQTRACPLGNILPGWRP